MTVRAAELLEPRIGSVVFSHRSNSGRQWRINGRGAQGWRLVPLAPDGSVAENVKLLWRTTEQLQRDWVVWS